MIVVTVFGASILLVVLQGILANREGYLTQAQMQRQRITTGYSFFEHGGMWADVSVIPAIVSYLLTHYRFAYTSWYSLLILGIAVGGIIPANQAYNKIGLQHPVAHNHDGHITAAGWIHVVFAIIVIWLVGMFYLTPVRPTPSHNAFLIVSGMLTPFFFLGIVDFSSRWEFLKGAKIQLAAQIAVLWIVTFVRLRFV